MTATDTERRRSSSFQAPSRPPFVDFIEFLGWHVTCTNSAHAACCSRTLDSRPWGKPSATRSSRGKQRSLTPAARAPESRCLEARRVSRPASGVGRGQGHPPLGGAHRGPLEPRRLVRRERPAAHHREAEPAKGRQLPRSHQAGKTGRPLRSARREQQDHGVPAWHQPVAGVGSSEGRDAQARRPHEGAIGHHGSRAQRTPCMHLQLGGDGADAQCLVALGQSG